MAKFGHTPAPEVDPAFWTRGEETAHAACKTLLVLDTATGGDAERLYARLGRTFVGTVPDYALWPNGGFCGASFYYRRLV